MSSNFIPMLSSSPPPIDDIDSPENDDEDDDFGTFASANHDFDTSFGSPAINESVNFDNNSSLHRKEKKCNQINCSFKGADVPVFPVEKRDGPNIKLTLHQDNGELQCEKGGSDVESEVNDTPVAEFTDTSKRHFINHSSVASDGGISPSQGKDDGKSSQESVPLSDKCNIAMQEESSVVSEPYSANIHTVNSSKPDDVPETNSEFEFPENYLDDEDDLSDSSKFCDFESVNISERLNGEKEECLFRSDCLLRASPNSKRNSDSNVNSMKNNDCGDALDQNAKLSDSEETLHFHTPSGDHEPLARTDPPHVKCNSLSSSRCSDDFDDFKFAAAVDEMNTSVSVENVENSCISTAIPSAECIEENDDNFGDFESVKVPSPTMLTESASASCNPDDDDFADFESSEFLNDRSWKASGAGFDSTETEGFADFVEAGKQMEFEISPTPAVISKESPGGLDKIAKVICTVFPVSEKTDLNDESDLNSCDILERNSKSRRLWEKLHDTNQTPGIPFQWSVSHSFQQLLRSVNVDYHSILRTSTVPFFATGLGLLEPTKGPGTMSDNDSNDIQSNDNEIPIGSSKDPIPPVHFDWGSSGLVNPLDAVHVASTLIMDLSFLKSSEEATSGATMSKTFSLENELLKPDSDASRNLSTKAPILEQLLSLNANSSALAADAMTGSRPPNLSEEAVRVLDQLPDISFIRAKMLMFPVSSNT